MSAHTHQYAVTKASQIGNSFSQFSPNDHRGNANVSDAAGAFSLLASINSIVTPGGRGDQGPCDVAFNRMIEDKTLYRPIFISLKKEHKCVCIKTGRKKNKQKRSGVLAARAVLLTSHLHLNRLLFTDDSEMSFCGGLACIRLQPTSRKPRIYRTTRVSKKKKSIFLNQPIDLREQ